MNIFAFDPCPRQSALWLDDVRKCKMILESAQLLSAAVCLNSVGTDWHTKVYQLTHTGHPCCKWVSLTRGNFAWLLEHMKALATQWGSPHKSATLIPVFEKYLNEGNFYAGDKQTKHPNCAANADYGLSFKHIPDVHEAYRLYINERWKRDTIALTWFKGQQPEWRVK